MALHLANLRRSPAVQRALAKAAADPESRGFATAIRVLTDYDPRKPRAGVTLEAGKSLAELLAVASRPTAGE